MPTQLLEAGLTICAPKVFGEQSNLTFGGGGTHTRRQRRNASPDGRDTTRQAAGRHASHGGGAAPRLGAARCVNLLRRHQVSSSGGLTAAAAPRLAWRRCHALRQRSVSPGDPPGPAVAARLGRWLATVCPAGWTAFLALGRRRSAAAWTALRLRQYTSPGSGGTPRPAVAMPRLARQQRRYASPGCGDRPSPAPTGFAHWRIARRQPATRLAGEAAARLARRRRCHASPGGGVNASPCGNATVRWAANRLDDPSLCKIGPGAGRPTGSRRLQ